MEHILAELKAIVAKIEVELGIEKAPEAPAPEAKAAQPEAPAAPASPATPEPPAA
jgi:hypothetical protein